VDIFLKNTTPLLYGMPTGHRRRVFSEEMGRTLKEVCMGISERHEMLFIEISADEDCVHFLIQHIPILSPERIV
jgi:REP element-mobilizing transposase RayT